MAAVTMPAPMVGFKEVRGAAKNAPITVIGWPKAINVPLHEVRIRLDELDKDKHYVCYCTTGRRSSAAAFLLVQRGYKISVLNGGVQVMAQDLVK